MQGKYWVLSQFLNLLSTVISSMNGVGLRVTMPDVSVFESINSQAAFSDAVF